MRLSKTMLHPYSKNRFYIPCTFELRTYDAMRTQPRFNTHNHQRLTFFDSMGDQVVMTHAKQTNDNSKNKKLLCLAEQRPTYFLPFRCTYLSQIPIHFTSTRTPPASRDS